jgi:hypothetical protein
MSAILARYGLWVPVQLWEAWVWLGWQWPISVEWLGVQKKMIIWVFEAPLSISLIVIGSIVALSAIRVTASSEAVRHWNALTKVANRE